MREGRDLLHCMLQMLELIVDREGKRFSKNLSVQSTYQEISCDFLQTKLKEEKMEDIDIEKNLKTLGIEKSIKNLTIREVISAWKKAALLNHPDKKKPDEQKEFTIKIQEINEAYQNFQIFRG